MLPARSCGIATAVCRSVSGYRYVPRLRFHKCNMEAFSVRNSASREGAVERFFRATSPSDFTGKDRFSFQKNASLGRLTDGTVAQNKQNKCSEHTKCTKREADTPMRRSAKIDPGRYQKQDASNQPPRTPEERVPVKQRFRSADADGTTQREYTYGEVEAPMHEQECPCAPAEDEQCPAGNHSAPGLDQRERDEPTDYFEDGGDPQHRNNPWNVGTSELHDFW